MGFRLTIKVTCDEMTQHQDRARPSTVAAPPLWTPSSYYQLESAVPQGLTQPDYPLAVSHHLLSRFTMVVSPSPEVARQR